MIARDCIYHGTLHQRKVWETRHAMSTIVFVYYTALSGGMEKLQKPGQLWQFCKHIDGVLISYESCPTR